ncbi:hypothetical protein [uncultured Roseobacter sp.]|uniref:hypothetical protein n=1 Tax=uncultured Roseobacter sp. TaxID=114847 RepID=UPI0026384A0E|nr:hypothetical protein [uncultured Roseobacter sp.]
MNVRLTLMAALPLFFLGSATFATTLSNEPMQEAEAVICEKLQTCSRLGACYEAEGQLLLVSTEAPDGVVAEDGVVLWASSSEAPHRLERIDVSKDGSAFDADGWGLANYFFRVPEEMKDRPGMEWLIRILVPDDIDVGVNEGRVTARIYETLSSEHEYTYQTLSCSHWGAN